MKQFDVPIFYKSDIISRIKGFRKESDPRKKDFSPTILDFGPVRFLIARHFGFCYGVENAIEISYKAIEENPDKRIFLLSEMIHNPQVNKDLNDRGIKFLYDTYGNELIGLDKLEKGDVVIIPAFGTTVEMNERLAQKDLDLIQYNTTCPFVERVWKKSEKLGKDNYTIIIHGKHHHEETRATFSNSQQFSHALVLKDLKEAKKLARYILGDMSREEFMSNFHSRFSEGFDPDIHLERIGVVNQTTMLAEDTQEIADFLKDTLLKKYGSNENKEHFADTRDTLCYATNDNQTATKELLNSESDLAIVVGGYNSSNTSHLVHLCEQKLSTYFIDVPEKIVDRENIVHYDLSFGMERRTKNFLVEKEKLTITITSGASCPDATVDAVIKRILSYFPEALAIEEVMKAFEPT